MIFAIVAAVLLFLNAFGVNWDVADLFKLGLAFWALHFGWDYDVRNRRRA